MKIINFVANSPTISTWLSFASKALNFTVIIPLLLNILSAEDISLWYLYLILINLLTVLDAGFGSTFVRIISYNMSGIKDVGNEYIGKSDNSGEPNVAYLNSADKLMKKFYGYLSLLSIFLLATLGTYVFYIPLNASSDGNLAWFTWWYVVISYPILVWGNVYVNTLLGTHNIPLVRLWETLFNSISVLTNILVILYFKNVYILIFFNQVWLIASVLRNLFLVRKKFQFNSAEELNTLQLSKLRQMVIPSALKSGVGVLMSLGIIQGSGFILARYVPASTLAPYLFSLNTIQAIKSFAQAPFYSKIPLFSSLTGNGNLEKLISISKQSMRLVYLVYSFFFFLLAFFGQDIFNLFNSKIEFPDKLLWSIFGLAFLIERYGAMHLQIYSTTNNIIWHKVNGITGLLMIIIGIALYSYMGVYAMPVSLLLSYSLFYSWYCPKKSYEFLKVKFSAYEASVFFPFVLLFLLYLSYFFIVV